MTYSIWIPDWAPPSVNVLLGLHPNSRSREKRIATNMVATYALYYGVPEAKGPRKVRVKIVLGRGKRGCDPDNYNKILRDALKAARLILDDRSQTATFEEPVIDRDHRDKPGTLIEIEEGL